MHRRTRTALVLALTFALAGAALAQAVTPVVQVRYDAALGHFLTDDAGMTLYVFSNDEPGVSNCVDACAVNWPPVIVGDASLITNPLAIPAGFDTAAFERSARDQFMALQAANDAGDLGRLRDYLTPDMFEAVREEVVERGSTVQKTEVFGLQSQVLNVAEEEAQYVVSVRFSGSVRTEAGATPEDLDEVWHLTKPRAGFGGWVVAGIQQAG